jgi:hypothetical protein
VGSGVAPGNVAVSGEGEGLEKVAAHRCSKVAVRFGIQRGGATGPYGDMRERRW